VTVIGAVIVIRRRASELDEIFLPLGLEGRGYLTNGRQYHGTFRGYAIHAYFYRGPTLQIYLDVPLGTRVGMGRHGAISRLAADMTDKKPLPVDDPDFDHLVIYPDDICWASDLIADPKAREIILRLTDEESATELRTLSITPNALLWQSRYNPVRNINPETIRTRIEDLFELARIAVDLTAPTITATESGIEQTSRTDRSKYTWPIVGITCGVIAAMAGCIIAISAVVIILAESGL
ncbi:hypothetical protein VU04_12065, partial [Desulfobulbus sp. TB]|nr:hypothetical protein [Desulfobulbus sp. TB]